jgi:plastocyanin
VGWLAILLTLASLGGGKAVEKRCAKAAVSAHSKPQCKQAKSRKKPKRRPGAKPTAPGAPAAGDPSPAATPVPTAAPGATAAPPATATPPPVTYPSRTGVDLSEWALRPSYTALASGRVVLNAAKLGEDDHNLSVRGGGHEYGRVDVAPGDTGALVLQLPAGTYTLYCSLQGHEEQGMRADVAVR